MKKIVLGLISALLTFALILSLAGCGSSKVKIAIPNDTTNEARALLLLENLDLIKLKEGAGITATILDIEDNPYNIEFNEVEAAQLPNVLPDVNFAVINSNYAISAKINPAKDALGLEGAYTAYSNIVAVREGNEKEPLVLALVAALKSKKVKDFITDKYDSAVISVVEKTTDGFDAEVDYEALKGQKISVAASPAPHAEILEVAKEILAEKQIELDIQEYEDYVVPNNIVEDGTVLANYFQHFPYLDDFNEKNGTHIVSVADIHVEPLGIYGGKSKSLDEIKEQEK